MTSLTKFEDLPFPITERDGMYRDGRTRIIHSVRSKFYLSYSIITKNMSLLQWFIVNKSEEEIKALLKYNKDHRSKTDTEFIDMLNYESTDIEGIHKYSALWYAIYITNNVNKVKLLIDAGCDISHGDEKHPIIQLILTSIKLKNQSQNIKQLKMENASF